MNNWQDKDEKQFIGTHGDITDADGVVVGGIMSQDEFKEWCEKQAKTRFDYDLGE